MKIITISREFGSGGRELGKRMADLLGFGYYDREIISAIAEKQGLDAAYVENALEKGTLHRFPFTFRRSFSVAALTQQAAPTQLLVEQGRVIQEIARAGKDCVIVGRNADILLRDENPLNLFVHAEAAAKLRRCRERAGEGERLTQGEMEQRIRRIDAGRARTREILSGSKWGQKEAYHLTINTTDWTIKELAPAVAEFAARWFERSR